MQKKKKQKKTHVLIYFAQRKRLFALIYRKLCRHQIIKLI